MSDVVTAQFRIYKNYLCGFFAAELAEKHGWHWKSFQTVYILLQYKNFILYGHSPMAKIAKVLVVKTISSFAKLSQVR